MKFLTGTHTAVDPANNVWVIRRLWFPRWALPDARKRFLWWRGRMGRLGWEGIEGFEGIGEYFFVVLGALLVLGVIVFFVIPILLIIFDLFILLFFILLAILGRVLFKRPWVVEATSFDGQKIERNVIGWYESKKEIEILKSKILKGDFGSSDPALEPLWPRNR